MTARLAADVLAFGETMAMFRAEQAGDLAKATGYRRQLAGADSNVAIGLARLGLSVRWVSRVGRDSFGRFIRAALTAEGLDCQYLHVDEHRATGFQLKGRCDDGRDPTVEYFRRDSAASALSPADMPAICFEGLRHLHCTGIPAAISTSARRLCHHAIDQARAAGASVSFDPNLRPSLWASHTEMVREINALACKADWVLPGLDEGQALTGCDTADDIADFYLAQGVAEVIIKDGPRGASWHTRHRGHRVPGLTVDPVVDTVGAGDGFAAGFISARLEQLSPLEALARGNRIGARVVGFPGDSDGLPDRNQLAEYKAHA